MKDIRKALRSFWAGQQHLTQRRVDGFGVSGLDVARAVERQRKGPLRWHGDQLVGEVLPTITM